MTKKHYFYLTLSIALVIGGFGWTALQLMEPKAIPKIKWSVVQEPQKFAVSQEFRMHDEIKNADWIVIGIPDNREIWTQQISYFIQALQEERTIWVADEADFREPLNGGQPVKRFSWSEAPGDEATDLGQSMRADKLGVTGRHILITSTMDALSFNEGSRGYWLRLNHKKSFHLIWSEIIEKREQEAAMTIPCDTSGKQFAIGRLGCEILNLSRLNYRKIKKSGTGWGFVMSQISERDYLALLRFSTVNK